MSKHKWLVLFAGCALIAAFFVGRYAVQARIASQTMPRPFLIEMHEKVFADQNPQQLLGEFRFVYAVRSDGSHAYANIEKTGDGWRILSRRLELVGDLKTAIVSDVAGLVSSFRLGSRRAEMLAKAWTPINCTQAGLVPAGEDTILGYRVLKFERDDQYAHVERWVAPDLACHTLKAHLQLKGPDGTIASTSEDVAISVREGEPPSELFDVPSTFTEGPPSKIYLRNLTSSECCDTENTKGLKKKLEAADQAYDVLKYTPPPK